MISSDYTNRLQNLAIIKALAGIEAEPLPQPELILPPMAIMDGRIAAGSDLQFCRELIGDAVAECAVWSLSEPEMFSRLQAVMPKGYPALLAAGSTRGVFTLPLGLVMKVERPDPTIDPLEPNDLEFRGGEQYNNHLTIRRRLSNLTELKFAIRYPNATVPVYGAAFSFGQWRSNPSVLVVKQLRPLTDDIDDPMNGVSYRDLALDIDGFLHNFDKRFSKEQRPRSGFRWCNTLPVFPPDESSIFLGNLGVDGDDGSLRFLDRGNYPVPAIDKVSFTPWKNDLYPGSADHRRMTAIIGKSMMLAYKDALLSAEAQAQERTTANL